MSPLVTLRLAAAGSRSDAVRVALTAVGAALPTVALLAVGAVLAIRTPPGLRYGDYGVSFDDGRSVEGYVPPYTNALLNESGLRPGVALGLAMLTIPILAFVAQCGRLGAPARERRLAAIRMAGGTPRQVVWVAAVETGLASTLGVALGFGAFLLGRALLDAPDRLGQRPLPTDVLPRPAWLVGVAVAVPLFVTLLAVLTLRRVAVSPLGVVRENRRGRPSLAPGVVLLAGVGAWALVEPANQLFARREQAGNLPAVVMVSLVLAGLVAVSIGVVTGTGWITYTAGRLLRRFARRPATLLAGHRMVADPWSGSRTLAAMLVALIVGSIAAGLGALTFAEMRAADENSRRSAELAGWSGEGVSSAPFFERAYDLVGYAVLVAVLIAAAGLLVALADGLVARRRTLTSLIAAGTPRGVLARALGWQVLTPVVPSAAVALAVGILLPRSMRGEPKAPGTIEALRCEPLPGDPADVCQDAAYQQAHGVMVSAPEAVASVEVPWDQLALLGGGAIGATVTVTLIGLLFLRMSTRVSELRAT